MATAKDVKDKKLSDDRREFVFEPIGSDEAKIYYIGVPSGEDIRKADWEYSKIYNQAIVDGFLTQTQMTELLKEKGIITEEYTQALEDAKVALGAEIFKLEHLVFDASDDEREALAMEVGRRRDELFILNQKVNGPMANTCENKAEDARTDYLTSRVVQNEDGSLLWDTYKDYCQDENTGLVVRARFEVMLWLQGMDSNFLENTPEQKTLREVALKRLENEEKARLEEEASTETDKEEEKVEPKKEKVSSRRKPKPKPAVEDIELPAEDVSIPAPKKTSKRGRPRGSKNKDKSEE